ncbi:MAG: HDOD domain-containing protein [Thermodesulfobacteriota bacterium]|nr:HDOD domain-containing protein [Thermodesulfobacteriota bacterium]
MNEMREIIKDIKRLEPIPQVANRILSLADDPDCPMSELSELILYDQALTANLLRICNSAHFGLSERIESVHHAVVFLGLSQVIDLVLLAGSAKNLKLEQKGYGLHEGELWRNSVSSALIARELADKKGSKNNHLIFTAALLKDIGKVILSRYVSDSFESIYGLVSTQGLSFREAEKEVLGIDHAEVGAMVGETWKFSSRMVEIIRNHHMSEESKYSDFETSIVHLSDMLCMMMGIGVGSDGLAYRFHRGVVDHLGFTDRDMQGIMSDFADKMHQVEEIMNVS